MFDIKRHRKDVKYVLLAAPFFIAFIALLRIGHIGYAVAALVVYLVIAYKGYRQSEKNAVEEIKEETGIDVGKLKEPE